MTRTILMRGAIVKAGYGVIAVLRPQVMVGNGNGTGENVDGVADARYFNRLLGARDLVGAALTIAAVRAGAEREALRYSMVCEALDSISLLGELRERGGIDRSLRVGLVFNLGGWLRWLRAARALT